MKKSFCLILTLALIICCFSGCKKDVIPPATEASQAVIDMITALPEKYPGATSAYNEIAKTYDVKTEEQMTNLRVIGGELDRIAEYYGQLTDDEKKSVVNYGDYETKKNEYDSLSFIYSLIRKVDDADTKRGTGYLNNFETLKAEYEEAKGKYSALSDEAKSCVSAFNGIEETLASFESIPERAKQPAAVYVRAFNDSVNKDGKYTVTAVGCLRMLHPHTGKEIFMCAVACTLADGTEKNFYSHGSMQYEGFNENSFYNALLNSVSDSFADKPVDSDTDPLANGNVTLDAAEILALASALDVAPAQKAQTEETTAGPAAQTEDTTAAETAETTAAAGE